MGQCQTVLGPDPVLEKVALYESHAESSLEKGNAEQAIWYYNMALQTFSEAEGDYREEVGALYFKIIRVYERELMLQEALEMYKKAFDLYSRMYSWDHPQVQELCKKLAERYHADNEFEKAAYYYDILLKYIIDRGGENSKEAADIHDRLGNVYQDMDNYRDSVAHYSRALDIKKRSNTLDLDALANEYNKLGGVYSDNVGDLERAKECFQNTLDIMKETHGNIHEEVSIAYLNLGHVKAKLRDYEGAKKDLEECVNIGKKSVWALEDTKNSTLELAYVLLAVVHEALGRNKEALEYEKTWAQLQLKEEEDKIKSKEEDEATCQYHEAYFSRILGHLCIALGQYAEAEVHFNFALQLLNKLNEDDLEFARTYFGLGLAYLHNKDVKALDCFKASLERFAVAYGEGCDEVYEVMKYVAIFKLQQGSYKEAIDDLTELLETYKKRYLEFHPTHIAIVDLKHQLGLAHKAAGNYEAALKYLNEAYEERENPQIGYIRRYGTKDPVVYEVNGISFDMPELDRIVTKHCEILKIETKRMSARANVIGRPKILPSSEEIHKDLVEVRDKLEKFGKF